jgi:hypothetical protein
MEDGFEVVALAWVFRVEELEQADQKFVIEVLLENLNPARNQTRMLEMMQP